MSEGGLGALLDRKARRAAGVECLDTDEGYLIHDLPNDRVHYLNPTAAAVLAMLDGERSGHEVSRLLAALFELPEPPDAEVLSCLEQLSAEGLITED